MKRYVLFAILGATLVAGCATNNSQSAKTDDDKVVVTGSRIPRNDRSAAGVTSTDDKNAITEMMRPRPGPGVPGN